MRNSLPAFGRSRRSGRRTLPLRRFVLSPYPASIRSRRTSLSHSHHRFLALIPGTRSIICGAFHAYHSSGCPLRAIWRYDQKSKDAASIARGCLAHQLFGVSACLFPPVLALLSLGHPLSAFPAPGGSARLCFSGSFPKKSPAQPSAAAAHQKSSGRNFLRLLPKKRRLPLGAGHTRVAVREGVPSDIRANHKRRI